MIIKVKGYFIAVTIALIGCQGSAPSEMNENSTLNVVDSVVANVTEMPITHYDQPPLDSLHYDEDINCIEHLETVLNRALPAELEIVHCDYWSSQDAVWLEHTYFFELKKNTVFFEDLIAYNEMLKISDQEIPLAEGSDWFLTKPIQFYEGFYTEDDFDDFQIFRDKETGHIFIRGSQY